MRPGKLAAFGRDAHVGHRTFSASCPVHITSSAESTGSAESFVTHGSDKEFQRIVNRRREAAGRPRDRGRCRSSLRTSLKGWAIVDWKWILPRVEPSAHDYERLAEQDVTPDFSAIPVLIAVGKLGRRVLTNSGVLQIFDSHVILFAASPVDGSLVVLAGGPVHDVEVVGKPRLSLGTGVMLRFGEEAVVGEGLVGPTGETVLYVQLHPNAANRGSLKGIKRARQRVADFEAALERAKHG
jgi:hypothetical protein